MQIYIPDKFVQSQRLPRKINWGGNSTGSSTTIELNSQKSAVVTVKFFLFNDKKRVRNSFLLQHSHRKDFQRQATKRRSRIEGDGKFSYSFSSQAFFLQDRCSKTVGKIFPSILRDSFPLLPLRASFLSPISILSKINAPHFEFSVGARAQGSLLCLIFDALAVVNLYLPQDCCSLTTPLRLQFAFVNLFITHSNGQW